MAEERPFKRSPGGGSELDPPWSDYYDMAPLPRETGPTYHLFPDPHSGIAITPLPPPGAAQRLAMLELWSPQHPSSAPTVITRHSPAPAPHKDFAGDAHLKLMGELTVSIAHEVCQPLMAIASNAAACIRWLQRDNPNISETLAGLTDIRADCERAASIVSALRALAKQSPGTPAPVDVNALILEALRLHSQTLSAQRITLEVELDAEQTVIADPVQIQQLVFNLIANAMEAIAAEPTVEGVVRVSSRSLRDGVQVSVEDNGPGIPVQARQQIFDAFYTTKTSGLGMGLTICRSVVEAHKGNLYAEASDLGGAMVRFQLPTGCKNH